MVTAQKITIRPPCAGDKWLRRWDNRIEQILWSALPLWGINGFGFFWPRGADDMKRRNVAALDKDPDEDPPKRSLRKDFSNNCLADFVTKNTRRFFLKMKIDQKFPTEPLAHGMVNQAIWWPESWYKGSKSQMTLQNVGWHLFKNTAGL